MLGLVVTAVVAVSSAAVRLELVDPNAFAPLGGRLDPQALEDFVFKRTYSSENGVRGH